MRPAPRMDDLYRQVSWLAAQTSISCLPKFPTMGNVSGHVERTCRLQLRAQPRHRCFHLTVFPLSSRRHRPTKHRHTRNLHIAYASVKRNRPRKRASRIPAGRVGRTFSVQDPLSREVLEARREFFRKPNSQGPEKFGCKGPARWMRAGQVTRKPLAVYLGGSATAARRRSETRRDSCTRQGQRSHQRHPDHRSGSSSQQQDRYRPNHQRPRTLQRTACHHGCKS